MTFVEGLVIVLLAAGLVGGLSLVLAVLLLLAERYLVDYGLCSIDINDGQRRVEVTGGDTLLGSLMDEGIFIPSACGGQGTCSYCKVKILEGGGPVAPTEEPLLTAEEIAADIRISCQCKVRNDLRIEIPEELFSVRRFGGTIERIRDLTYDIKELRIRLSDGEAIEFVPGQYVQLQAAPYGGVRESVYRAYSMSNPPSDDRAVETIIRLVPGGICTTWVFTVLTEGQEVSFTGPYGHFRLTGGDREMIWIAGGSGMAPFWSMLRHMKEANIARRCTYFFGAVRKRDLFLLDELRRMERELDWFTFVPALSNPAPDDEWDGQTGLITEVVDRGIDTLAGKEVYLCGSPGMIDAAVGIIRRKDVDESMIFFDKFE